MVSSLSLQGRARDWATSRNGLEALLWLVLLGSLFFGLFGFAFFTLRPENLARWPHFAGWYAPAMIWGAQMQSGVCVALMLLRAGELWGWNVAVRALIVLTAIGFLAEWVGTSTGYPFGAYHYTDMLGYKIDGLVPWVIPPSWFAMGIPSYFLARHLVERIAPRAQEIDSHRRRRAWARVLLGGWLLMCWDLVLDPAMSHLLPYWQWLEEGFFYASPFINFVGWFVVGVLIMAVLEWGFSLAHRRPVPWTWALAFYGLTVLLSAGLCLLAGEALPVVVFAIGVALGVTGVAFLLRWGQPGIVAASADPSAQGPRVSASPQRDPLS
jgi:uncharacterized membrane protein